MISEAYALATLLPFGSPLCKAVDCSTVEISAFESLTLLFCEMKGGSEFIGVWENIEVWLVLENGMSIVA